MIKRGLLSWLSCVLGIALLAGIVLAGCSSSQPTVKKDEDNPKFVNGKLNRGFI